MRRPAKVSYSFEPSSSSTYACPGTSLVQRMVSCVSFTSVTHGPASMPCDHAKKGSAMRMLRSANRFIGYSFEFVNLRKLLDFSKGCLAGPSAFENYFSGYPPEKPIFVGHRNAHAQNPLQLQSRHSDNLKHNMARILLKIVCADDLKHLFPGNPA